MLGLETVLVSLQNGIGNAEQLATLAPGHTVCATTSMGAILEANNTVLWTGRGPTQLAPFGKTPAHDANLIAGLLTTVGCVCHVLPDAASMLWGKLILNAAINPVTALYGIANGRLPEHPEARDQAFAAAREAMAVAKALGLKLAYDKAPTAITEVCRQTAANRSSMLQDIEQGRPTEIEAITGAIVAEADRLNIPVPVNKALYLAIRSMTPGP